MLDRFLRTWLQNEWQPGRTSLWVVLVQPSEQVQNALSLFLENNASGRSDIEVLPIADNVGYNLGVNAVIAQNVPLGRTDREHIAIFNDDVWFVRPTLEAMAEHLDNNPQVGAVGPRQIDSAGRITAAGIFGSNQRLADRHFHVHANADRNFNGGRFTDTQNAISLAGSAIMWRRDTIDELVACPDGTGTFMGPARHYWGETWACFHARRHGWHLAYMGSATVGHDWHSSYKPGSFIDRSHPEDKAAFRSWCEAHAIPHP